MWYSHIFMLYVGMWVRHMHHMHLDNVNIVHALRPVTGIGTGSLRFLFPARFGIDSGISRKFPRNTAAARNTSTILQYHHTKKPGPLGRNHCAHFGSPGEGCAPGVVQPYNVQPYNLRLVRRSYSAITQQDQCAHRNRGHTTTERRNWQPACAPDRCMKGCGKQAPPQSVGGWL